MSGVDLLVLGGGPAGATLAALAARAGARVRLLERARFPRDKVCGEFVSAEGCRVLERLGVLGSLLDRGARWMERFRLSDPRGRSIGAALPETARAPGRALGVTRALLDGTLLDLARGAGVEVREGWHASAPWLDGGRVRGVLARPTRRGRDDARRLLARLVVAADGRRSTLVRALHPRDGDPRHSDPRSWFGLKRHLGPGPGRLRGRVELHLFDHGYAGLGAVEDDNVNLCLMVTVATLRACGSSPERVLRERVLANPAARESLAGLAPRGAWRSVGPLRFGVRRPAAAGALFVGDAAGTIDPYSGAGISHALAGAEIALPWALRAAAAGELTPELARAYRREWERAFGPVTRRVRWLGRMLERPRLAAPVIGLLERGGATLLARLAAATRGGKRRAARSHAPG